jgi:hypothetical protein
MKNIGYYYSKSLALMMVGFIGKNGCLHGKVIKAKYYVYHYGYKYHNWYQSDFRYIGHGNPTEYYILMEELKNFSEV